jgi:transposase
MRKEPVMREKLRFVGLDVHAETIAAAVAEPDGEVRSLGTIANREDSIRKFIKKLGPREQLRACYEAGPTGFVLYWQLTQLGVECTVAAPTLVPKRSGDRVKTDRRDALKLARSHRSDDLTAVWVPDEGSEALRDLVRAREAAKQDQLRARHRLSKFLLRSGQRPAPGVKAWTQIYMAWIRQIRFAQMAQESTRLDYLHEVEHMGERVVRLEQAIAEAAKLASPEVQEVINGLQALRGIAHISAVTIAAELGQISRFESARKLMGYSGTVPSEDSSGERTQRGSITRTGNAHLRRIAVEAAWSYRLSPGVGPALRKRQQGVPDEIKEIAWKAQHRLHRRYCRLAATRKDQRKIITALGRELLGFIWAIGIKAETAARQRIAG